MSHTQSTQERGESTAELSMVNIDSSDPARLAQFYAAALFVETKVGKDKLLAVMKRALEGEPFERALDREVRWTMSDLEREFLAWIDQQRL